MLSAFAKSHPPAVHLGSASPRSAAAGSGWLWPLIGTAASIAFASAFSLTLRIWRGLAASRTAALHPPQAILVLGGDRLRERLAGRFAARLTDRVTRQDSSSNGTDRMTHDNGTSSSNDTDRLAHDNGTTSSNDGKSSSSFSSGGGGSGGGGGSVEILSFDSIFTSSPKLLIEGTLDPLPPAHAAASGKLPVFISSAHDDAADVMLGEGVAAGRLRVDNHALDTVTNFTSMLRTFQRLKISHVLVVTSDYHMPRAALLASIVLRTHGIAFSTVTLPSRRVTVRDNNGVQGTQAGRGEVGGLGVSLTRAGPKAGDGAGSKAGSKDFRSGNEGACGDAIMDGVLKEGGGKEEEDEVEAETKVRLERDRLRGLMWLVTGWHGAEFLRFTRPQRYRLHKQKPLTVCPDSKKQA